MKCPECGKYYIDQDMSCDCGYKPKPFKEKKPISFLKQVGIFLLAVFFISSIQVIIKETGRPIKTTINAKPAVIKTYLTSQDSQGVTSEHFTTEALSDFEKWIRDITIKKMDNYFIENGLDKPNREPEIFSKSVYITVDGVKLAIISLNIDNEMHMKSIIGVKDNKLLRVSCLRASNLDIPLTYGNCSKFITKTFGVAMLP